MFQPAFECAQRPKAGQNTQHIRLERTFGNMKNMGLCLCMIVKTGLGTDFYSKTILRDKTRFKEITSSFPKVHRNEND